MADVQFAVFKLDPQSKSAYSSKVVTAETVTSAASAQNSAVLTSDNGFAVKATAVGSGEVYAAVDVGAVASETTGVLLSPGMVHDFLNVPSGSRGSVIDK